MKEIRLLGRDLHGVAVLFMMPIVFMLIMSAALSGGDELNHNQAVVLLGEANELNKALAEQLRGHQLKVVEADTAQNETFQAALQSGEYALLLLNPNHENADLEEEQPLQLWLNPAVDRAWLLGVKGVARQHYSRLRLQRYLDGRVMVLDDNRLPAAKKIEEKLNAELKDAFGQVNRYLEREFWQEQYIGRSGEEVAKPDSVQHSVPAWLIFGMFFIMIPLSNVMTAERQTNTLTRLRLAQAPVWRLLAAKLIPYFCINQLQFIGMVVLGYWVLPRLGMSAFVLQGEWWQYAVLSCMVSLAALGYGLLISVLAKSTEHAVVLGGGGIIIMAALGGIMVPLHVMPEVMHKIAAFSPMGWGLGGFQALLLNRAQLRHISYDLLLLGLFGLVCLSVAAWFYRRELHTQVRL